MNELYEKYLEEDRQALAKIEKEYGPLSEADRIFFLKCASQSVRPTTPEQDEIADRNYQKMMEQVRIDRMEAEQQAKQKQAKHKQAKN